MPSYDYRCKTCGRAVTLSYKTYAEYDATARVCPHCGSEQLTRLIRSVAIQKPARDYANMSSQEMLSVMEAGDPRQVGELFRQVGAGVPDAPPVYHEATERLLKGDSMESVERDLRADTPPPAPAGE